MIDVAQDILLTHLSDDGLFDDLLVFKGGTALRKMCAGASGRFSTDLDFALATMDSDRESATQLLVESIHEYRADNFTYAVIERRGKYYITYDTPFLDVTELATKLDVGPPVWLPPTPRRWVPAPIHDYYDLPDVLPVMALEENLAEKVARLNRVVFARDLYDLWWVGSTSPFSAFDETLLTELAVLKCWIDVHGLHTANVTWLAVDGATTLNPDAWLDPSRKVGDDSIGLLASPAPQLKELHDNVISRYSFLRHLTGVHRKLESADQRLLGDVLTLLRALPGGRFGGVTAY